MSLTVSREGKVEYQNDRQAPRSMTLSKAEVQQLCSEIPATFPKPEPVPAIPDGMDYSLQVDDQKAVWGTGAPIPESLGPLLEHLEKIELKLQADS